MQQIMTHTADNCIYLQSAEIFKNAIVSLINKEGDEMTNQKMVNTNYLTIDAKLPKGEYLLVVVENGKQWKRSVFLGE